MHARICGIHTCTMARTTTTTRMKTTTVVIITRMRMMVMSCSTHSSIFTSLPSNLGVLSMPLDAAQKV